MIAFIVIAICLIEIAVAHLIDLPEYHTLILWQAEFVAVAALGVISEPTQRDKSVIAVMLIWFTWVFASDWLIPYVNPFFALYDVWVFSLLIMWALVRPYIYASADLSMRGENVYIGFYQGTHAPLLSSIGALSGLPFSSVVIVAGETVLRASGVGRMMVSTVSILNKNDYIFVDTKQKATPETFKLMDECNHKPTKAFGVFRTKCVKNCEPLLESLGLKPSNPFRYMPSLFYSQVMKESRK